MKLPTLDQFKRVVVKVGSSLLVDRARGAAKREWLEGLADDLADLHRRGADVLVVSSGAVALGRSVLGLPSGPLKLEDSQASAAVGQIALSRIWAEVLAERQIVAGQILVTFGDTEERRRYLNARETLARLMDMRAVPVINENDTVATSEIRYGDNDRLAARVATMASADLLILLSDVAGLYDSPPAQNPNARLIPVVRAHHCRDRGDGGGAASELSRGGMQTKIEAGKIATAGGAHMVIADGRKSHPVAADRQRRTLHLVPYALDAGHGAEKMDRRLACTPGRPDHRRRRRAGDRRWRQPAAGGGQGGGRRFRARRLRRSSATFRAARLAADWWAMTRRAPRGSSAAIRATFPRFSARRAGWR